jgi:polyphosphate glucokinase
MATSKTSTKRAVKTAVRRAAKSAVKGAVKSAAKGAEKGAARKAPVGRTAGAAAASKTAARRTGGTAKTAAKKTSTSRAASAAAVKKTPTSRAASTAAVKKTPASTMPKRATGKAAAAGAAAVKKATASGASVRAAKKTSATRSASTPAAKKAAPRKPSSATRATSHHHAALQPDAAHERILAIDVGGTGLKAAVLDSTGKMLGERVRVATPHPCTPDQLVDTLATLVEPLRAQHQLTRISIGFPGVVRDNLILTAPHLGDKGWHGVPVAASLAERLGGLPVRMINDAEVQGFAVIEGKGIELVLTLGTGAGTALFRDGELMPHLELSQHPVSKGRTYDEFIGSAARDETGDKQWNKRVEKIIAILAKVVNYDRLLIGGGNAVNLKFKLPANVSIVSNSAGLEGGAKLWYPQAVRETRGQ